MKSLKKILVSLSLLLMPCDLLAGDLVVISHPSVSIDSLTSDEVMRIFLLKVRNYPNEKDVVPIIPKEGSGLRSQFEKKLFDKSPEQVRAYWTRLLFTGRAEPPEAFETDVEILNKVAESPSVIGYIDSAHVDDRVKVVFTLK